MSDYDYDYWSPPSDDLDWLDDHMVLPSDDELANLNAVAGGAIFTPCAAALLVEMTVVWDSNYGWLEEHTKAAQRQRSKEGYRAPKELEHFVTSDEEFATLGVLERAARKLRRMGTRVFNDQELRLIERRATVDKLGRTDRRDRLQEHIRRVWEVWQQCGGPPGSHGVRYVNGVIDGPMIDILMELFAQAGVPEDRWPPDGALREAIDEGIPFSYPKTFASVEAEKARRQRWRAS